MVGSRWKIVPKLCPSRSNISKWFQTKPKVSWKSGIESTACNYDVFGFSKYLTENPRVGSSILSLGTSKIKSLANTVKPFLFWLVACVGISVAPVQKRASHLSPNPPYCAGRSQLSYGFHDPGFAGWPLSTSSLSLFLNDANFLQTGEKIWKSDTSVSYPTRNIARK
jgi:hypothetical protein